jgi:hypothetical protein
VRSFDCGPSEGERYGAVAALDPDTVFNHIVTAAHAPEVVRRSFVGTEAVPTTRQLVRDLLASPDSTPDQLMELMRAGARPGQLSAALLATVRALSLAELRDVQSPAKQSSLTRTSNGLVQAAQSPGQYFDQALPAVRQRAKGRTVHSPVQNVFTGRNQIASGFVSVNYDASGELTQPGMRVTEIREAGANPGDQPERVTIRSTLPGFGGGEYIMRSDPSHPGRLAVYGQSWHPTRGWQETLVSPQTHGVSSEVIAHAMMTEFAYSFGVNNFEPGADPLAKELASRIPGRANRTVGQAVGHLLTAEARVMIGENSQPVGLDARVASGTPLTVVADGTIRQVYAI